MKGAGRQFAVGLGEQTHSDIGVQSSEEPGDALVQTCALQDLIAGMSTG